MLLLNSFCMLPLIYRHHFCNVLQHSGYLLMFPFIEVFLPGNFLTHHSWKDDREPSSSCQREQILFYTCSWYNMVNMVTPNSMCNTQVEEFQMSKWVVMYYPLSPGKYFGCGTFKVWSISLISCYHLQHTFSHFNKTPKLF